MNLLKRSLAVITAVTVIVTMFTFVPMAQAAVSVKPEVSVQPLSSSSAYVVFSDTIKSKYMTFKDGLLDGVTDKSSELYSEKVTLDGVEARKLYKGNYIYVSLDKTKFSGSKMLIVLNYYDFGPSEGSFQLHYSSTTNAYKSLTVRKTGMELGWKTVSFLVDDAAFNGSMNHGSDIRIFCSGPYNAISKIEVMDYSAYTYVGTKGIYAPTSVSNSPSGRTWEYLNFGGKPAIRPYVTEQGWNRDGTKFIFSSYDTMQSTDATTGAATTVPNPDTFVLYEYDIENNIVRQLDTGISANNQSLTAIVTPDDYIYYAKADGKTWKMNWLTYEKEQTKANTGGTMSITNDGEWVTGYGGSGHLVYRQNTKTGVTEQLSINYAKNVWLQLDNNLNGKGHPMINPEYPDLMFFCHEGTTTVVPDRLWYGNFDTGEVYNMFLQAGDENTVNTKETSGHEVWSYDGEYMYWVKYTYDQNLNQSGLMRMDKFGSNREYINGDYAFWHCYPSMDNNFVVGDTNKSLVSGDKKPHKIVIVNTNSYKSTVIAEFKSEDTNHPNQPHPHISINNYSVSWQLMKNGVTCIGWDTVRDITEFAESRRTIDFGNDTEIITCTGAPSEVSTYTKDGVSYYKAASGKGIYVNIKDIVCKSTNAPIQLKISYLDNGTKPLKIVYTSGVTARSELAVRENKSTTIARGNTNKLKTTTVNLGNINCNDIGKFMSDICLTTDSGDTYISAIEVIAPDLTETELAGQEISVKAVSGNLDESKGLMCTSVANEPKYNNTLYHVDDVEGWQAAGITQETVDEAKKLSYSYVTLSVDGAWAYKTIADSAGSSRDAYFAPRNYRQNGSYKTISGNVYFKVTDETITENDNELTFTIDYLDNCNFNVTYTSTASNGLSSFTVKSSGTNLWKQASVTVTDAKISSTNKSTKLANQVEDIKLESASSEMYFSGVAVTKAATDANASTVTQKITYHGNGILADKQKRVSTEADGEGDIVNGLECTAYHNTDSYDNRIYHVDDTSAWQSAGFTQDNIDAAKASNCNYVTKSVDGGWMFKDVTDAAGVTKSTFYAPRNWRPSTSGPVNSNIYLKVTSDDIIETYNDVILVIEYLDTGAPFIITYTSTESAGLSSTRLTTKGTGLFKKAIIVLDDAKMSSTNSRTQLAKWVEDIKISGNGADMYIASVSVMKKAESSIGAEAIGDSIISSNMEEGAISTTVATVKNASSGVQTVSAYTVVFAADGTIKGIEKSPYTDIAAGETKQLTVPEVALSTGDTYKTFVWESNLAPVPTLRDDIKLRAAKSSDGVITLTWNDSKWDGDYYYNIISDGKLVARTRTGKYIFDDVSGDAAYVIDVTDKYGKSVFRSNSITISE